MSFATNIESEGECLECIHLEKSNKALRKSIDELKEALKHAKEALLIATQDAVSWQRRLHSTVEAIETINKLIP